MTLVCGGGTAAFGVASVAFSGSRSTGSPRLAGSAERTGVSGVSGNNARPVSLTASVKWWSWPLNASGCRPARVQLLITPAKSISDWVASSFSRLITTGAHSNNRGGLRHFIVELISKQRSRVIEKLEDNSRNRTSFNLEAGFWHWVVPCGSYIGCEGAKITEMPRKMQWRVLSNMKLNRGCN